MLQQVHRRQSSLAGAKTELRESTLEVGSGKCRLLLESATMGGSNAHWGQPRQDSSAGTQSVSADSKPAGQMWVWESQPFDLRMDPGWLPMAL